MVGVRRIANDAAFDELASTWDELVDAGGHTTPFLSYDWMWCCWHALRRGERAEIVVVEEGGRPIGLVPLMHRCERRSGLNVRCLGILASPDTAATDVLAVSEPTPVVTAFLNHLGERSDWDVFEIQKLPVGSPTLPVLERLLHGRFRWRRHGALSSPYLSIRGEWAAFWRDFATVRMKKTLRNVQNRLQRAGRVTVEEHRKVDPEGRVVDEAIELSRRSWKADQGVAIATMDRMPEFFRELSRRAALRGWLSLWFLRLDGRLIAAEYQLQAAGTVHALRADFDADYAHLSPGTALAFAIVRALFERGDVHEYDMGPGLNDYKLRWATGTHETVSLQLYRDRGYGRALHLLETVLVPAARAVRERWPARETSGKRSETQR